MYLGFFLIIAGLLSHHDWMMWLGAFLLFMSVMED
jgi:hypothetical protein